MPSDVERLPVSAQPGSVLAGKYRIDCVLGIGGMGAVVRAQHLVLEEMVAVKFLLPELAKNEEAAARFLREAKAALRIKSDHVVRILDVDRLEDGTPYMVMELLQGFDLDALLVAHGPFSTEQAVDAIIQASAALADAHAAGIVHRDIKPGNLFEAEDGRGGSVVKVLDFGISKLTGAGEQSMTSTTAVMGSALYMAPEQLQSARDVDARCDIYALGVTLFELLSGTLPYEGETMPQLIAAVLSGARRDLSELRPDLPPGLADVVHRAMAKSRDDRHASAEDLAVALTPYASPRGAAISQRITMAPALPRRIGGDMAAGVAARPTNEAQSNTAIPMVNDATVLAPGPARGRWRWLGVGGVMLLGVGVLATVLLSGAETPADPDAGSAAEPGATAVETVAATGTSSPVSTSTEATAEPSASTAATASATAVVAAPPTTRQPHGSPPPGPSPTRTTTKTQDDYGGRK